MRNQNRKHILHFVVSEDYIRLLEVKKYSWRNISQSFHQHNISENYQKSVIQRGKLKARENKFTSGDKRHSISLGKET